MTLLSKLTPRGVSLESARGGIPEVTAADVCAAMSMSGITNPVQYHLLMIRGADQWPNNAETEMILQEIQNMVVLEWNRRLGQPRPRLDKVPAIAEVAWREAVGPQMIEERRAAHAKMTQGGWNQTVKELYAEVCRRIEEQYFEGMAQLKRNIF